jgi:ankyrin repeat protein
MHIRKNLWAPFTLVILIIVAASQLVIRAAKGSSLAQVSFTAPQNFTVGSLPFNNVLADFNGDGILDMAVANSGTDTVTVLFGKGDGTFTTSATYTVGNEPVALVAADFNGDKSLDLAVANELGTGKKQCLSILINNGDGTFKPAVNYAGGQAPRGIAFGDFNNDGIVDLAVVNNLSNNVSIYLGIGDGTFKPAVSYNAHTHPKAVAVGSFRGNGILDLAVANHDSNDVSVLLGNGDGTFNTAVNYPVDLNPRDVEVADLRNDGLLDLVTANGGSTTVSVLLGNGDGTFATAKQYTANRSPRWAAIADYNGDGILDIATSDYDAAAVSVLLGNGDGTFGAPVLQLKVDAEPTGIKAADLTGDGKPDLVVTIGGLPTAPNDLVSVMLNLPLLVSPSSLTFNTLLLGTRASEPVTLTNTSPKAIPITIALTGADPADFVEKTTCPASIASNSSCTITVVFAPTRINLRTATLSITDSAPGGGQSVSLQGTGTVVELTPTSLTFPAQTVKTTSNPMQVTLTDISKASSVGVTSVSITGTNAGDFAETNNCTTVAPSGSCQINVTFTPTATGTRVATLSISDNGGGSPQTVPLTGTGQ